MNRIEEGLSALQDLPVEVPEGVAGRAWRQARARRRRATAAGATLSVAVLAVGTVGVIDLTRPTHRASTELSTASGGGGAALGAAGGAVRLSDAASATAADSSAGAGLDAITLADPAPGFPYRLAADATLNSVGADDHTTAPARTFRVSVKPYGPAQKTASGSTVTPVVSDQATVEVARATPAGENVIGNDPGAYPLTGATTARGCPATVTTYVSPAGTTVGPQVGVHVTVGGYAIAAYGSSFDSTGAPQDPQHLIPALNTLINTIGGITGTTCG